MTTEEKAKAYDEAMERAKKELKQDLHESGVWAIQRIFPELRESEDEITRKRLINLIRELASATVPIMTGGYFIDGQDKRYIAYLEKQKDAFENGRQLGIMQEQARQELGWPDEKKKEHQNNSDAPEKALGRDLISPKDKDKNLDEIAQDYVEGVKEYNPEPTWDLIQTAVCYGYHYCEQKEEGYEAIPVKFTLEYKLGFADGRDYEKQKEPHFTKRNALFDKCVANCDPAVMQRVSDEVDEMLEKEQKPAEWSEEEDQLIGFIFDLLNSLVWRKEWAMDKKECLEKLKSLRPSWKPSEWQMSMLLAVINDPNNAGSESCHLTLKSIYEQLKKLM